ncbi:MAG: GAF domain-containing sensor histidine kinase [Actinomycetota bacterium]|nr:GAF domain-containing sensor histidine kinase [Actinomycetota bacterium]
MSNKTTPRIVWLAIALVAPVLVVARISFDLAVNGRLPDVEVAFPLGMITYSAAGALILSRRPGNVIGRLLVVVGAAASIGLSLAMYTEARPFLPGRRWTAVFSEAVWPIGLGSLILILQLFPDGRVLSNRWRFGVWLTVTAAALLSLGILLEPGDLAEAPDLTNPLGVEALRGHGLEDGELGTAWLLLAASILVAAVSVVVRFRRSTGEQREQLKWLAFAGSLLLVGWILIMFTWDAPSGPVKVASFVVLGISLVMLPIGVAIAVLRYRLYDIDVVVNKTVVYGSLAAFITAVYVGVVVGIGTLLGRGDEPNLALSILATAVVAVAFQPIRERVQHVANRLVYGKRATPYEVLSHFAERMSSTYATDDLLPRMAAILQEGTGAARAEVWLTVGAELRRVVSSPPEDGTETAVLGLYGDEVPEIPSAHRSVPVRHQGELLGALAIAKGPGEPVTPAEEKLMNDLASQAGLVLRNVKLIEELRASRQRIVSAQDEERRRIERNIHDGAQQQLVALNVKLGLARTLVSKDAEKAQQMIEQLQIETQEALENLRDLARGIYPPLLADKGLVAALEAQARKAPLPVRVEANGVGRLARDAEATVYFCVLEALQNVAKYAGASTAVVQVSTTNGEVSFAVRDDGTGFDPSKTPPGSGLTNMTDRIEALGGALEIRSEPGSGTTVTGRVPIPDEVAA